jgi:hypothetical protein
MLALACGGKDSNEAASNASSGDGSNSVALVNFSESAAKLMELKSFRFDFSMKLDLGSLGLSTGSGTADAMGEAFAAAMLGILGDIKAEGAYVSPDQMDVRLSMAGQQLGFVQTGDRAWVNEGSGWTATSPTAGFGIGESPADLFSDFLPQEILRGAKTSSETVNGVKATRYSFDKTALEQVAKDLGESADLEDVMEANLDVWLTDGNVPVKITMKMAGKDGSGQGMTMNLEVNVRDINSNSIQIKSPI